MKGAWPPHLLPAENPIPPALGPLPCQAPVGMDAHPRLLALGSVGQCRRLRNSSSSLGTSWFKYRMPWRREQRKPVIRLSRVICRAWCKMKTWGPSDKEVQDSQSRALNQARALLMEKAMASHFSTFAWKIPWTEEPGGLQSMGSLELDTTERLHFHFSLSCIEEGNGNPLQCSCLENPRDGEAWWAAISGVAQSRTQLKRLSSSSRALLKDRNGMDLTEAEDIKKKWQKYTEELYKKDLHDPDNHDGVITDLEPDILECEVKWVLESITTNKASGGDAIPVELFQILKDDAVKVLHSICQQIWKTQQWPQDWKRSVFIPIPKKGNAKECSNYRTIALISHASKGMLKILQARLQQYVNRELPDVQAGFRKGRGTRDQIANICWIMEKAREFQKNIYFCFIDYAKAFDCVDHNKLWTILKEMGIPDHLTCLLRNLYAGQEATVRTRHGTTDWFQIGKGLCQGCILSPCLFNLYAEYIMRNAGLEETQAGIKIAGRNINNLRYADDTTFIAESEEELKSLLMKVKVGLKAQHSENKDHGIRSHHFVGNRWGNSGNTVRLYFWGLQNHCRW
uniref:RNA-directed DNA polymerase n=1 Tax=Bos indicus x Bos taurus TaxID=30522 RepID=A0A4W2I334_BOBOX